MITFIKNKRWYKYAEITAGCILGTIIGIGIGALCIWLQYECHR